jgi:hypothetical protein
MNSPFIFSNIFVQLVYVLKNSIFIPLKKEQICLVNFLNSSEYLVSDS